MGDRRRCSILAASGWLGPMGAVVMGRTGFVLLITVGDRKGISDTVVVYLDCGVLLIATESFTRMISEYFFGVASSGPP